MRYAVLSDVHGNKPALDAVLEDARSQGIENIIVAGDYLWFLPVSLSEG